MTRIRLTNIPLQRQFHYAPDNASQKLIDGPPNEARIFNQLAAVRGIAQ
jgi:hypothetical protein